jgi:tetratricopeptide (TPR) repeat protein
MLEKLAGEYPGSWANDYNRGNLLAEPGRWEEAIECFERALELTATPPWAERLPAKLIGWIHNNRGQARCQGFRFGEARRSFSSALKLNPDDETANENLGIMGEIGQVLLEETAKASGLAN